MQYGAARAAEARASVSWRARAARQLSRTDDRTRDLVALLPPLVAFAIQLAAWSLIRPYVWFLFFPAVFASARVGSVRGGLLATLESAVLVWWFFVAPTHTIVKHDPRLYFPLVTFVLMGAVFSWFQSSLRSAREEATRALARTEEANDELSMTNAALVESNERVLDLLAKTTAAERAKSEFFANISHELRTPLALILGPVQSLLATTAPGTQSHDQLAVVDRQAHHLLRLVNELLEGSTLEAGEARLRPVPTDLVQLVRSVASQFDALTAERDVKLTIHASRPLEVTADPERLQRVFVNLLANAVKFTPRGGHIRVSVAPSDDDSAVVEVADTGPGIRPEHRELVFERFRQVEGGANRRFGGTGLGLAIVRDLVELHGGTVAVDTAPEGGALLRVVLPRAGSAAFPAVAADTDLTPQEPDVGTGSVIAALAGTHVADSVAEATDLGAGDLDTVDSRPLVLVVEDHPDLAVFLRDCLGDAYRVVLAGDGRQGVESARELMPALVVTDLMMPVFTGEDLVRELRSDARLATIPVLVLTARADEETRARVLRMGANDYVTKPFDVAELKARVGNLIRLFSAERELFDALARAEGLLHASPHATLVVDREGIIVQANRQATEMFGYTTAQLTGQSVEILLPPALREKHPHLRAGFTAHPRARAMGSGLDLVACRADGSLFPVDVSLSPLDTADGQVTIAAVRDVTAQREAEQRLEHLATHDSLTELANRARFVAQLDEAMRSAREDGSLVGVLYVDLDEFKLVNDQYGHDIGDELLMHVAKELSESVRPNDLVARVGGDEFAVVCTQLRETAEAAALAQRILHRLAEPFTASGIAIYPGVSIGVATTAFEPRVPDELVVAADLAMYNAKANGRGHVVVFDPTLLAEGNERAAGVAMIRRALADDRLRLLYQPIVDLRTGDTVGVEALVRIEDSERGLLLPAEFLPVAEETGLILPLGTWVIEEAARQIGRWQQKGIRLEVAVNLSGRQLNDRDLDVVVLAALAAAGADPHLLCIEVTETMIMDANPGVLHRVERLKLAGVSLAIDDFGTGWSSLTYLKHLPVDEIKIDRSFTLGIGRDERDTSIVTALVQLAHALGVRTTVEGIEDAELADRVRDLDCDYGQGFLFARPMPAEQVETFIATRHLESHRG